MSTYFHTDDLWAGIRRTARDAGPRFVAVPFVSTGAVRRLPLKRGDVLVTRCNLAAVKSGQTDPREIVRFIKRGVRVHNVSTLHAKVYVSSQRCVVASANLSHESEHRLVEAGVESSNRRLVAEARKFVRSLCGEVVEPEFVRILVRHYRPPRRPNGGAKASKGGRVRHSDLWVIGVHEADYSDQDQAAAQAAELDARKRGANERVVRLEHLSLDVRGAGPRLGDRVLQVDGTLRGKRIIPPARVMSAKRYRTARGGKRLMLALTVPKGTRLVPLRSAVKKLGSKARVLGQIGQRRVTDADLVVSVARLWPDRARPVVSRRRPRN